MADELSAPLSRRKKKAKSSATPLDRLRHLPLARLAFGLIGLIVIGMGLRIALVDTPEGGRPSSTVAINSTRDANVIVGALSTKPPATVIPAPKPPAMTPSDGPSITIVNPDLPDTAASPASAHGVPNKQGIIPDLAEDTKDGAIPRISATGQTPFAAYSRASVTPEAANGKALVAIVVTGLGLSENGTMDAITKLPGDVTLAFAPYGKTLRHTVAAAQASGHELLLEAPFEPFDYPDNDPGPQTLLTNQPARANLNKLYWLMARFGGYIGIINHTGARFTASAADFGPVMEELGTRGLGYLDDGTSNRSLAAQLADKDKVPFARADAMLDATPSRAAILTALDALVAKAHNTGSAIGVISALPVSIQTVSQWANDLAGQNIVLVPVSALMK